MPILRSALVLAVAVASVGCATTRDDARAPRGAAAEPAPRVMITSHATPAPKADERSLRMSLAGEPWTTGPRATAAFAAEIMPSPAAGDFHPWGTSSGARILTMTATRADDGRRFVLQIAIPKGGPRAETDVGALAEYRTTEGRVWRAQGRACRVRVTRLTRDARGEEASVSVEFELEMSTPGEPRSLSVSGRAETSSIARADP